MVHIKVNVSMTNYRVNMTSKYKWMKSNWFITRNSYAYSTPFESMFELIKGRTEVRFHNGNFEDCYNNYFNLFFIHNELRGNLNCIYLISYGKCRSFC